MESSKIDYDFKKSFIQKAIISGCIFIIACIIAGVVHHYFYYLDAFLYTYEFYLVLGTLIWGYGDIPFK